jgi:hypothetical protein
MEKAFKRPGFALQTVFVCEKYAFPPSLARRSGETMKTGAERMNGEKTTTGAGTREPKITNAL